MGVIIVSEELKEFNINLEDIKESNNLFDDLHEAIEKMRLHTLSDRFEVVLNNNLIESKEKLTNFRTILGCRISYDNLDKNISFIVREDNKPSYEELEQEINRLNNIINKLEKWLKDNIEYGDDDYYDMKAMGVESALNKLKELKENK
jgi:hypothetical protein